MSPEHEHRLTESILLVGHELRGIREQMQSHNNNAILHRLAEMEKKIIMELKDVTAALITLSTATDTLSLKTDALQAQNSVFGGKVDTLVDDTNKLITAVQNNVPTIPQALADAVAKAQASAAAADVESTKTDAAVAAAAAAGDKVDVAVTNADKVLPTPAPPGA